MISFQVSQGPGTVWPSGMYKLSTNQEQDISGISDVPKVPAWKSLPFCLGRNESRSGDLLSPWSCPVLNIAKTAWLPTLQGANLCGSINRATDEQPRWLVPHEFPCDGGDGGGVFRRQGEVAPGLTDGLDGCILGKRLGTR